MRLVAGDARELLPGLPGGAFDLIVTDPPYTFDRGNSSHRFPEWFDMLPDEAWPAIFAEMHRLLAPDSTAYVFCDYRAHPIFDAAARAAGLRVRAPLVWDKLSPGLGGGWRAQYELVAWYQKGQPTSSGGRGNVLRHGRVRGYPTEKPRELIAELVRQSSYPGQLLLDPFCGSGGVGTVAARLGRRALLIDTAPETAERRLRIAAFRHAIAAREPGAA